jgi:phosphoglycerol transferase MdoB-like AlkP superfamily enzyme
MTSPLRAVGALFLWPPVRRLTRLLAALWAVLALPKWIRRACALRPHALVALGLASVFLTVQMLRFSSVQADWALALGFLGKPLLFLLNWLPVAGALYLLYFATGRPHWAYALTCLPCIGLALVNYYKLRLRGDPLLFADIRLMGEAAAIGGRYTFTLTGGVLAAALMAVGLVWLLAARYRAARRPRACRRLLGMLLCAALLFGYARLLLPSDALYSRTALSASWMPTHSHVAHGVAYPFLRSAAALSDMPPAGYDAAQAAAALAAYQDADIPQGNKVNIIAIMLEAFADFSTLEGLTFTADPYADWHALAAEGYSGQLVTNIFAGETVNTERAFLTGYIDPTDNFRAPVESFVWYLRAQGYRTRGSHPGNSWFYNRLNVNRYFGFEQYDFYENRYRLYIRGAKVLPDAKFVPTIFSDYRISRAAGGPLFSFHVTYQNHGPYPTQPQYQTPYLVQKPGVDAQNFAIANNYLHGVAETGKQLRALADQLRGEAAPVVLVLFGDHMPWWGDGNETYAQYGVNLDRTTEQGFYNYFTTPYIIWANDAAKQVTGCAFAGDGGRMSPAFLMPRLFTLLGWQGPAYMQALRDLAAHTAFVNRERWLDGGVLAGGGAPGDEPAWLRDFRMLEYYVKQRGVTPLSP